MNDMVAATNNFSYYVFYKGFTIDVTKVRELRSKGINVILPDPRFEALVSNNSIDTIIYLSHAAVYAGDIYEFDGHQYLGTWDVINRSASRGLIDVLRNDPDVDDDEDLSITNETFRQYRKVTGKGGDFLALSSLKLHPLNAVIPIIRGQQYGNTLVW